MKRLIYVVPWMLFVASCTSDFVSPEPEDITPMTEINHTRSIASAVEHLYQFMEQTEEGASTRAAEEKKIKNVQVITRWNAPTRSLASDMPSDMDTLLYVVNFENEAGFAILAADERTPEVVLGLGDSGTIEIGGPVDIDDSRPIFEGYPLDGPGFFTDPERFGDELFMNPNTADLFNAEYNEYLIGNLRLDDIGAVDENGNPYEGLNTQPEDYITELLIGMCLEYVTPHKPDLPDPGVSPIEIGDDPDRPIIIGPDQPGPGGSNQTKLITTHSPWTILEKVSPLLGFAIYWHQDSPFNDYTPERRRYWLFGPRRHAPAGCFPLAAAKVLTYFEHPRDLTWKNKLVNLTELKKSFQTDLGKEAARLLLATVGDGCDSWYFYNGTFTFPWRVVSYLRSHAYPTTKDTSYAFDKIKDMLKKSKPVIAYGLPGVKIHKAHAWNIDGYKIQQRTDTLRTYIGTFLYKEELGQTTNVMVHCDFGWKGTANGYYVSGLFESNKEFNELDFPSDIQPQFNYSKHRILIY